MADLPNGTTIGGQKIIHKGIANKHRHNASDIDGLNTLATGEQGSGGGIDADVLSGNTYADLSNEFLLVQNDSISELILANHPTQNNQAVSRLYLQDSIPQNMKSGSFYGITSIGDQSQETYDYTVLDSYNIRFSSTECLVNGSKYIVPQTTIDIRDVNTNFENKDFYAYLLVDSGSATIVIQEQLDVNTDSMIFVGELETDSTGIESFTPISGIERVGIERYMLSMIPKEYSIPVSDDTGKINNGWIFGSRGETIISLTGQTEINSGENHSYTITNYNSFSTYEIVNIPVGLSASFVNEETIEISFPNIIPTQENYEIIITKDGYENSFNITGIADPSVTISGPTEINSGGSNYQYIIGNYNPSYSYTVTSTHGTVSRNDDIITLITPTTLESDVTATIEVTREGSNDSINIDILATPPFEIDGPNEVWQSGSFNYTLNPYVNTSTYNISTSDPNVTTSFSNGIITVNVPAGTTEEYTFDLTVSSPEEGNVTRTLTVMGDPDPYDITLSGEYGINLYEAIGSPAPALNYTINLTGTVYGIYEAFFGGSYNYAIRTGTFPSGSTLTLNINNIDLYGKGGDGGGVNTVDGSPGGDGLIIQTPTTLTISSSTIRAGSGGGGQATRYYTNIGSGGKSQSTTVISKGAGGGGGTWSTDSLVTASVGNVSSTDPVSATNSNGTAGGTAVNDETGPNGENHGTFYHYGGAGGNSGGTPGAPSSGSSGFVDNTFTYSEGNAGSGSSTIYEGYLGVGGAAGLAIRGNGNVTEFNDNGNVFVGSIQL